MGCELPRWLSGKASACSVGDAGDVSLIPGSGRSAGEGNGNPLKYSCLGNSMHSGAWQATVHGVANSQTPLSDQRFYLLDMLCNLITWNVRHLLVE